MKKQTALASVLLTAVMATTMAQDTVQKTGWSSSLAMGANLASGNSKTKAFTGALIGEMSTDIHDVRVGVEGNYGKAVIQKEIDGVKQTIDNTTAQNAKTFANGKRKFNRNYIFTDDTLLYDDRADIDSRLVIGAGGGRFLVDNSQTKLGVDFGAAYVREDLSNVSKINDSFAYRVSARIDQKMSDTAKVWGSVEYLPMAKDLNDSLLNSEVGAEAALNTRLSLHVVIQDRYDNKPPMDRASNDLLATGSVVYKF